MSEKTTIERISDRIPGGRTTIGEARDGGHQAVARVRYVGFSTGAREGDDKPWRPVPSERKKQVNLGGHNYTFRQQSSDSGHSQWISIPERRKSHAEEFDEADDDKYEVEWHWEQ